MPSLIPNCFHLPEPKVHPVQLGNFIGDVEQGGSCNVDMLTYCPHNVTHIETSAHILKGVSASLSEIPLDRFVGQCFLMDLSWLPPYGMINPETIIEKLKSINRPISMVAIKTVASQLPQHYDFSDKDFLALSPGAAKVLHDYTLIDGTPIRTLLLDLPSADKEKDEGRLLSHRKFFGIPDQGVDGVDQELRAIVELAHFGNLPEGYYSCVFTPPRFQVNAIATDIYFFKDLGH